MTVADNIRSDAKFMRLALLLEPEIARMVEQQAARTLGHDEATFDGGRGVVTYSARGHLLWVARAELIGSLLPDFGLWSWWWTGRINPSGARCSLDLALSEGQRHGVHTLMAEHPRVQTEEDAQLLSSVCAQLARADGMHRVLDEDKVTFYALFEAVKGRRPSALPGQPSMKPPGIAGGQGSLRPAPSPGSLTRAPLGPLANPGGGGSMGGPVGESIFAPSPLRADVPVIGSEVPRSGGVPRGLADLARETSHRPTIVPGPEDPFELPTDVRARAVVPATASLPPRAIVEPARDILLPLVQAAAAAVAAATPAGFQQAMLVVTVDIHEAKARFAVLIVVSDERGGLTLLDTPAAVVDAAGRMIAEDARGGNGRWRRLTVRIRRTSRGAHIEVAVR